MDVALPTWSQALFKPYRYKIISGGRASGKSYSIATALLIMGISKSLKVICAREFQASIAHSSKALLEECIERYGLGGYYQVQNTTIKSTVNGTEFLFFGVAQNIENIKSVPSIDILWIEEASNTSKKSWDVIVPTVRDEGSEIWASYNPDNEDDVIHQVGQALKDSPDAFVTHVTYRDNPHLPSTIASEIEALKHRDYQDYLHVYEGQTRQLNEAQILTNWRLDTVDLSGFEGPYYGLDFGFSSSPTALVKAYVSEDQSQVYVEASYTRLGLPIDQTSEYFLAREGFGLSKHEVVCDSSRPESIDLLNRTGLPRAISCHKSAGYVETGISWLQGREIIVHPDCGELLEELTKYSYKVDRNGTVLPQIVKEHDHCIDALRMALQGFIIKPKSKKFSIKGF